jgi:hypothetical protein
MALPFGSGATPIVASISVPEPELLGFGGAASCATSNDPDKPGTNAEGTDTAGLIAPSFDGWSAP